MEPFATRDDLVKKFGSAEISSLEDPDNQGYSSDSVSTDALLNASEVLASHISVALRFPLDKVPLSLRSYTCDVARWMLYKDKPTEEITYRYEQAIAWAKRVGEGKAVLIFEPELTATEIAAAQDSTAALAKVGYATAKTYTDAMLDKMPTADKLANGWYL